MLKSEKTKRKIIEVGAKLIYYNGYKNTSVNLIIKECGIAKGNFYYYFQTKDQLLYEIIDYHTSNFINLFNHVITEVSVKSIKNFFSIYIKEIQKNGYHGGSPLGNLSLELSDLNETIRIKLKEADHKIIDRISIFIQLLRNVPLIEAIHMSNILLTCFEGTVARIKLEKSGECIESFFYLFDKIIF